ncbi:conserved hypothetical protein [Vibrio coralliirubri]|uniref:methionyl-tRNA formyltransferase n=1 Tax=Vibrio coralliirubri TaxID=1516159 RepID=UPI00063A3218|nr:formyltransferase family protein [Vibrio coralliirubri]CDT99652.1 conserved hypothetical protein [Vibrio coralliirubri]
MEPKFAVFTGSSMTVPMIAVLHQRQQLACVVLPDGEMNPDLSQLTQTLGQSDIPVIQYQNNNEAILVAQLDEVRANVGLCSFFRHQFTDVAIHYFGGQLFNLHPGDLPEYKGACPIYWQIRNGEQELFLTIHRIERHYDSGDIGAQSIVNIHPFDTLASVSEKVAQAAPLLLTEFVDAWLDQRIDWCPQASIPHEYGKQGHENRLDSTDLMINWQQHCSQEIADMVRAGNPLYGGAVSEFCHGQFQLVEATATEAVFTGVKAGTVVEVSVTSGLIVRTVDRTVRLDIVSTPYGVMSGYRFAQLWQINAGSELGASACR